MNPDLTIKVGTVWYDVEHSTLNRYDGQGWSQYQLDPEKYEIKLNRLAAKYPAVAAAKAYLDEMVALVEHE